MSGPQRWPLPDAMQALSLHLQASLGASSHLGDSLTKGELREEIVVAALQPYLPRRWEICKGVIVTSAGEQSDPQDAVLLDSLNVPPILGVGNTRVVPVEGVGGTIQIKSIATKAKVEEAVKNIASAKRLFPNQPRFGFPLAGAGESGIWSTSASFFGGAIFLSRRSPIETIVDTFARAVHGLPAEERCDALCVVDEGTVLWGNPEHGPGSLQFIFRAEEAPAPVLLPAGADSLLCFHLSLLEHLAHWIAPPIRWMDYALGSSDRRSPLFDNTGYSFWYDDSNPPVWANLWPG